MAHGLRLFLRNSGYVVLGHAATTLFAFAYAVVLARVLGSEAYATLAFGLAWYLTFIALSYLGIDVILARGIGRERATAPRLSGSTLMLRLTAAAVVAIVAVAIGVMVAPDDDVRRLVAVLGLALVSRSVWLWCQSVFTAFEDTRRGLVIDLTCRPLEFALGASVLVLGGRSVVEIGAVHSLVWTIQAAIGIAVVIRRVTPLQVRWAITDALHLLRQGWPGALYSLAVIWFLQAPIVLFTAAGDKEQRGSFALTVQIIGYLMVVPYLAASVGLPLLSRSAARRDGKTARAIKVVLIAVPLGGAVLGLLTWVLAPSLIDMVFGPEYSTAGDMLRLGVWLLVPMTIAISMQQMIFAGREARWLSIAPAVGGVVVMAAAFVPATVSWDYAGAFAATGLGLVVWASGAVVLGRRAGLRAGQRAATLN